MHYFCGHSGFLQEFILILHWTNDLMNFFNSFPLQFDSRVLTQNVCKLHRTYMYEVGFSWYTSLKREEILIELSPLNITPNIQKNSYNFDCQMYTEEIPYPFIWLLIHS